MGLLVFVAGVLAFWCIIYLNFRLLQVFAPHYYDRLCVVDPNDSSPTAPFSSVPLPRHGTFYHIEHAFGTFRITTNAFNPVMREIGSRFAMVWQTWFTVGAVFGCIALVMSLLLLVVGGWTMVVGIVNAAWVGIAKSASEVMEGVSGDDMKRDMEEVVAKNRSFIYSTGPALDHPTSGNKQFLVSLGSFMNLGMVSRQHGAFVDIHDISLNLLTPFAKLRIICAGVWHNLVTALLAWLVIVTLPTLLAPAYRNLADPSAGGVVVLEVSKASPLKSHLVRGAFVIGIDDVPISRGIAGWEGALVLSLAEKSTAKPGYCIPTSRLSAPGCSVDEDCGVKKEDGEGTRCMVPRVKGNPYVRVVRLRVVEPHHVQFAVMEGGKRATVRSECEEMGEEDSVVCWGSKGDLVRVGTLFPRFKFAPLGLPYQLERLLHFMLSFNLALFLLNMVPAPTLDGHLAFSALYDLVLTLAFEKSNTVGNTWKGRKKRLCFGWGWVLQCSLDL
ncbi:hypothetical protein BC829DRAFT_420254 [Chytridium lagenaria]|nr:hypothetical protein BC829DRAFT_420254 [Chytridium lagenaria]